MQTHTTHMFYTHTQKHTHIYIGKATECNSCVPFLQLGTYSDPTEVTTAAGPPGQCGAPLIALNNNTCVTLNWEVRHTAISMKVENHFIWAKKM